MTRYIPSKIRPVDLQMMWNYQYRSHSYHKTRVEHCIESTYSNSSPSYHVGFSPFIDQRIFVSFYRYNNNSVMFFQKYLNSESQGKEQGLPIKDGETYLVCFNSSSYELSVVYNNVVYSSKMSPFDEEIEWHAFFDGGLYSHTEFTYLTVNFGASTFKNKIPDGYYPWIYGIDGVRGIPTFISSSAKPNLSLCFFIILINY